MRFEKRLPNDTATLLLLSIFLIALLGLSDQVGDAPASTRSRSRSSARSASSSSTATWLFGYLRGDIEHERALEEPTHVVLPFPLAIALLAVAGVCGGAGLRMVRRRDRPGRREARDLEGVHRAS